MTRKKKKAETFSVTKYMLVVYDGGSSPSIETYDTEEDVLEAFALYSCSGTAVEAYETVKLELEVIHTARRLPRVDD